MIKVYVAGPISRGHVAANIHRAIQVANQLCDLGFTPYVPHLNHFWDLVTPRPYAFWIKLDKEFLPCCSAVLRIPGESLGADYETTFAEERGIPVFHAIEELCKHFGMTYIREEG